MPFLQIRLFGNVQVVLDQQPVAGFRTTKALALLVFLAVERDREHHREQLMTMLWPDILPKSAATNLRQVLYQLRQAIPAMPPEEDGEPTSFLMNHRRRLRIHPDYNLDVDALRFTTLLAAARKRQVGAWQQDPGVREALATAVDLYQGPFLADLYLPDSNPFEEWAHATREQLRRQNLDALATLATLHLGNGDLPAAEAFARRQLEIDPLREDAYRQLMEILARSGRSAQALALYDRCARLLRNDLGMAPATRTQEVAGQIREGTLGQARTQTRGIRGYELQEKVAEGGFGTVYRARQVAVERIVAVKAIRARYANDPRFIRRFELEAQVVARLEHPFIVPLYDYWREPDGAFLVMRWLPGGNLATRLETGQLELAQVVTFLDQIGGALRHAHGHEVIHRDLKPANILLDEAGNFYLSDFGIAKHLRRDQELTGHNELLGSPRYSSPEQVLDEAISPQTDIYLLGLVLFEVLTGQAPFAGSSLATLIYKQLNEALPLVRTLRPELPPAVDAVLQQATAKDPRARHATVGKMVAALRHALLPGTAEQATFAATPLPAALDGNPYRGLRPFDEADAELFYGRQRLVVQLLQRWREPLPEEPAGAPRFLAVVGPSGSGKSSLVHAGLIPAVREGALAGSDQWFVATMVPGADPFAALDRALQPVAVDPPASILEPLLKDERGLVRTLRRVLPDGATGRRGQLLLVVDQFEELFTLVESEKTRRAFIALLLTALRDSRSQLRLVITLRADFYDRPLQYVGLGELLREQTAVVTPLGPQALEEVIRQPALRAGVALEEGLVATIIADVAHQPGALPLLQFALTELYDERRGRLLTAAAYREIGGVTGALGRRAEALYAELDPPEQEHARQIFLRLVTLGEGSEDTRRRVTLTELQRMAPGATFAAPLLLQTLLDRFGRHRLLTFDRNSETREPTVEVAHEALLREWVRLRRWLGDSREDVRLQRRLARASQDWQRAGRDDSYLLRGARLTQVAAWAEQTAIALTEDEQRYLQRSRAFHQALQAEEEARRRRELETARRLAETERQRATEQGAAARRLQQRAYWLVGALGLALLLALLAGSLAQRAATNAAAAGTEAAAAATAESEARAAQADAETQARLARARELAGLAIGNLEVDPELSVLLALEAVKTSLKDDQEATREAAEALHLAVAQSSQLVASLNGRVNPATPVVFNPDGRLLAALDVDGRSRIWTVPEFAVVLAVPGFNPVFSADGSQLITIETDAAVTSVTRYTWRVADGQEIARETWPLSIDSERLIQLRLLGAGAYLAAVYVDGTVELLDFASGAQRRWHLHEDTVNWIAYDAQTQRFGTGSNDGSARVWPAPSRDRPVVSDTLTLPHDGYVQRLAFSPAGEYLVTVSDPWVGTVWRLTGATAGARQTTFSLLAHASLLEQVAFAPDGRRFATASSEKVVIWDTLTGQQQLTLATGALQLAFTPDGGTLVTVDERSLKVWDLAADPQREFLTLQAHAGQIWGLDYSADGRWVATAGADGFVRVWDADTGWQVYELSGHRGAVQDVAFSADGSLLASAGHDGTVRLWDMDRGVLRYKLEGFGAGYYLPFFEGAREVAFNPQGTLLAAAGIDRTVRIWDTASGTELEVLDGFDGPVRNVAFNADGSLLAINDSDNTAQLWQVHEHQMVGTVTTDWQILDLEFSPVADRLATSARDQSVQIWDLAQVGSAAVSTPLGTTAAELTLLGHTGDVWWMSFSRDGQYLVTVGPEAIKMWDAQSGAETLSLPARGQGALMPAAVSPDNRFLAAGTIDGALRFYAVDLQELMALARGRLTRGWTSEECVRFRINPCSARP